MLTQVPQIRPLADTVLSKHLFTYLLTYWLDVCFNCVTIDCRARTVSVFLNY